MRIFEPISPIMDDRGVIAVKFALVLPVLLAAVGFAIDETRFLQQRGALQQAVDTAAMAAAKELSLSDRKREDISQIANALVEAYVRDAPSRTRDDMLPETNTRVTSDPTEVEVTATLPFHGMFNNFLGVHFPDTEVRAIARVVGQPNICVLGLNNSEQGTISLEHKARVTGQDCAVYSNSDHTNGLKSKNDAVLSASIICTRGGKEGRPGNFWPTPLLDCPSFDDPLADRPEPFAGPCDPAVPTLIESDTRLEPGTYCGLKIANGARVDLADGIFVFRDAPLIVGDGAQLFSTGAGLYFTNGATFEFDRQSTISLAAPKSGPMAGLLIFGSRSLNSKLQFEILSDDARVMVGTIYIPKGELHIDATNPIADQSAYTAIVADKMRLYGGPHLVLHTNYSDTEVPVPEGIRGAGQPVVLAK
ncbi:MAG: pilus assembly protein [Hyphomicrobiaceae bacterium]|nr:pilus assembly protein [Hyphomicrobiaceae bacterium]